jgi:hypothetical protein
MQVYFRITGISNNPLPYALLIVTMPGCCGVYASALRAWAMLLLTLILVLVNSLLGKRVGALSSL